VLLKPSKVVEEKCVMDISMHPDDVDITQCSKKNGFRPEYSIEFNDLTHSWNIFYYDILAISFGID